MSIQQPPVNELIVSNIVRCGNITFGETFYTLQNFHVYPI